MKKTPTGTAVGVDDPYAHAGVCDHVTDDGKCRYAFDHPEHDRAFAAERRRDDFRCPAANDECAWRECPHYRSTGSSRECARCGLQERRNAHTDDRPLLEEHHLAYADERSKSAEHASGEAASDAGERHPVEESAEHASGEAASDAGEGELAHEITVFLCRWCHAKVHGSWARVDDDASPDPEALAEAEGRRSEELDELGFETAADRSEE
ncbi:DUF7097 family protein [Halocalculus aciditolerans]|uniref:Uncharacterized protein n=1 Tax=Halocalculus aciditolerans TaxID=1383812 RepID=A0A830FQH6_9EURY|nr:hypothetical protein [Halocalculus aciditolerans]GGL70672.1 hypothetical protein GCM10009039_30930 [Halocalculus aciditolerans]